MFRTQYDYFKYQVMSFELTNASVLFQIYINRALKDLMNIIYIIYLNDILIFNDESANHRRYVQQNLKCLKKSRIICQFKEMQIRYRQDQVSELHNIHQRNANELETNSND